MAREKVERRKEEEEGRLNWQEHCDTDVSNFSEIMNGEHAFIPSLLDPKDLYTIETFSVTAYV